MTPSYQRLSNFLLLAALAVRASGQIGVTFELPPATAGQPYRYPIAASAPDGARLTFSPADESPSDWLQVSRDGVLSGTPRENSPSPTRFTVRAASARAGEVVMTLVVPVGPCANPAECHQTQPDSGAFFSFHDEPDAGSDSPLSRVGTIQFHRILDPKGAARPSHDQGAFGHFNRTRNRFEWTLPPDAVAPELIAAVNASKVPIAGSILVAHGAAFCPMKDWKVVTETTDSSNILIYGASEVSVFCRPENPAAPSYALLIVLPVHVIWANVFEEDANPRDPSWRPIADIPAPHDCAGVNTDSAASVPEQGIRPCDTLYTYSPSPSPKIHGPNPIAKVVTFPLVAWVYNRAEQPGVSQGSLSVAPWDLSDKGTWDVQGYFSTRLPPFLHGWAGFTTMYEHDLTRKDDLNSFTAALTYDWRLGDSQNFLGGTYGAPLFGFRVPEFTLKAGPEFTPRLPLANGDSRAGRDLNLVGSALVRVPLIFNFLKQPSILSVLPLTGFEQGWRFESHEIAVPVHPVTYLAEPPQVSRYVAGADASLRWPFRLSHNFLGDKPITLDYSWRVRYLFRREPYVDENLATPYEEISTGPRHYTRLTLLMPLSAYLQIRAAWQHGVLPPEFQFAGNVFTLGITFSNPGSAEH